MLKELNIKSNARFRLSLIGYDAGFGIRNTVTADFYHE